MNMFLLAGDVDPVAKAVESLLSDVSGFQRVTDQEFVGIEFGSDDVLLFAENGASSELVNEAVFPSTGMIQNLGCRPSPALLSIASRSDSQVIVAGIAPNIAPRVANRVIGFTGPLSVSPMPSWGVIGVGEVGTEVAKKALATRSSVGIAEIRTPRSGLLTELGVRRHSLDLLVAGSDVITIHVHAGPTASPCQHPRSSENTAPHTLPPGARWDPRTAGSELVWVMTNLSWIGAQRAGRLMI